MKTLSISLLIFIPLTLAGQSAKEILTLANSASIENKNYLYEIPFEDKEGLFIIPIKIGSKTYNYIFDTGGYNTITPDIQNNMVLDSLMVVELGSSNQIKSNIALTQLPLSIQELNLQNVGAFVFDFKESPLINCYTDGGLIGKGIIKEAVWQVNYLDRKIIVSDNINNLSNHKNGIRLKVSLNKTYDPFIMVKINGKKEKFLVDFGFSGLISLTEETARNILNNDNLIGIYGEGAIGANGVSQEESSIGFLETLEIGNYEFSNVPVSFAKSNNYNLLGSALAKHFIITLNIPDKEIILSPYKNVNTSEEINGFGLTINVAGDKVYVNRLYKSFPAELSGIKLNDEIISVNGLHIENYEDCDYYFLFSDLIKSSETLNLVMKRDIETLTFHISRE